MKKSLCLLAVAAMLMNAGVWAHCDATFAMFTLWGLALLLDDHPLAGCILWGFALATKLQSAFLFPLLIVLFMNNRVQLRHILALLAAFLLCHLPILLDGQGLLNVISRYYWQLDVARWETVGLSDNMPNVYELMLVASTREFSGMGLYLGIASALLVVTALLRVNSALTLPIPASRKSSMALLNSQSALLSAPFAIFPACAARPRTATGWPARAPFSRARP